MMADLFAMPCCYIMQDAEEQQTAHRLRTELDEFRHTLEHERAEHAEVDRRNEKMIVDLKRSVERAEGDINKTNKLRDELEELREVASKVDWTALRGILSPSP